MGRPVGAKRGRDVVANEGVMRSTITAAAIRPPNGYSQTGAMALLPGFGLFGTVLTSLRRKRGAASRKKAVLTVVALLLLTLSLGFTVACGNNSNHQTPANQATVMVTGTSGALSHTATVAVTVN